jgi:catechol-2,3-dioxygenase
MATKPPAHLSLQAIHHIKLPSKDIIATQSFYTKILGFTALPQYNHYTADKKLFAVLFQHPTTKVILEARYAPELAEEEKKWDPITWAVNTREDLQAWGRWFDENNVKRSSILKGLKSWLMVAEDPDGKFVRLYVTGEEHSTGQPDVDEYWLPKIVADPKAVE